MRKVFLIVAFVFLNIVSFASMGESEVKQLWDKANSSYTEGSYSVALESYLKLEKEAGISASLYYNIGNCYYKEGQLAKAILYYNRANRMDPSNADIKHNLAVANAQTVNKIKEIPQFFLARWVEGLVNLMSSNGWAILSLVSFALLAAMIVSFLLSKRSVLRKFTFSLGSVAFVVTILAIVASVFQRMEQSNDNFGIVMNNAVAVKSSPDQSGKDIFVLNEGVKVEVLEKLGNWSKITISSGDTGWIAAENITII